MPPVTHALHARVDTLLIASYAVGAFIIILALAATLVLPKTRKIDQRLRLLPMLGGFIQLALFAPLVNFALSGWALYGLLSAASL